MPSVSAVGKLLRDTAKYSDRLAEIENREVVEIPEDWAEFASGLNILSAGRVMKFTPYDYQVKLMEAIREYPNVNVVKTRQMGISELCLAVCLAVSAKNRAQKTALFMPSQPDASAMSARLREMLRNNPYGLAAMTENISELRLKSGGMTIIRNSSEHAARGIASLQLLILDEAAFNKKAEKIYNAISAATSLLGDDARRIILSTPDLAAGWYYDRVSSGIASFGLICEQVASGELFSEELPGWYLLPASDGKSATAFVHWRAHPKYSAIDREYPGGYLQYRKDVDKIPDWATIFREYNLSFTSSANAAFNLTQIMLAGTGKILTKEAAVNRFEHVDYFIGVDPVGQGEDYCVLTVVEKVRKTNHHRVVAIYRKQGKDGTIDGKIRDCIDLIKVWKPKQVVVESVGVGASWGERIRKEIRHQNIHLIEHATSQGSKAMMVGELDLLLNSGQITLPARHPLLDELAVFARFGRSFSAPTGKHDDMVMSLLLALL
jgi:hypothetical protein